MELSGLWREMELARPLGLQAFKLGTEEEGLSAQEVAFVAGLVPPDLGIMVKIGGPCARADLRLAASVKATAVIAPMVESPFALMRFVEACALDLAERRPQTELAFNLETAQALGQLDTLLDHPSARELTFVNIGRSDLAASLGLTIVDPKMHGIVAHAISQISARNLPVHVGGSVTRASLLPLLEMAAISAFHTRFLAFAVGSRVAEAIDAALRLEVELLGILARQFPSRAESFDARAHETERRLQV